MHGFLRLVWLFLKQQVKSAAFVSATMVLLLLFASFALLMPDAQPVSAAIGLMFDSADGELAGACAPLLQSTALQFVYYPPSANIQMQQDVLSGRLHCAYTIDRDLDAPFTVYETPGTFLTPITDELVFSAWFETQLLPLTQALVQGEPAAQTRIAEEMTRLAQDGKPFGFNLTLNATLAPSSGNSGGLSPLLYAVLIALFLLCFAFSALLKPRGEADLAVLLRQAAHRPYLPQLAAVIAQMLLYSGVLALCEILLLLLGVDTGYSLAARGTLILLLSVGGALLSFVLSRVRAGSPLLFGLLLWAAVTVIFSGAIVSPEAFGRLGILRYASPAWWLLRLIARLG